MGIWRIKSWEIHILLPTPQEVPLNPDKAIKLFPEEDETMVLVSTAEDPIPIEKFTSVSEICTFIIMIKKILIQAFCSSTMLPKTRK